MNQRRYWMRGLFAVAALGFLNLGAALAQETRTTHATHDAARAGQMDQQDHQKFLLKGSYIIGHDVYGTQGDKIGDIEDLAIDRSNGRVAYALLDLDRLDGRLAAVPIQRLRFDYKGDGVWGIALRPEDVASIDRLPNVKDSDWNAALGREFADSVRSRFQTMTDRGETPVGMRDTTTLPAAQLVRCEKLVGLDLHNRQNDDLGEVEDLLINPSTGRVEYAVCATGGFLGVNENLQPVPLQALEVRDDKAVLNMDKERLKGAPSFSKNAWPKDVDDDLGRRVYTYYEVVYVTPSGTVTTEPSRDISGRDIGRDPSREPEPQPQEPRPAPQEPTRPPTQEPARDIGADRDRDRMRDEMKAPKMAVRATNVIGKDVYGTQADKLGDIEDLAIDTANGRVAFALLDLDRIADKLVAVPLQRLKFDRKSDGALGISLQTEEVAALDTLPSVSDKDWTMALGNDFAVRVRTHYGRFPDIDVDVERPVAVREGDRIPAANTWRATKLIGTDISTNVAEDVGEIEDLLIDPASGKIKYAVVGTGGVLGVGEKLHPVPLDALRMPAREGEKAVVNVDKNKMKGAPTFDRKNWPDKFDKDFCERIDSYYGVTRKDKDYKRDMDKEKKDEGAGRERGGHNEHPEKR